MNRVWRAGLFAWLLVIPSATHAQSAGDVLGCYVVRAGAWSDPARKARQTSDSVLPDTIRLRPEPAGGDLGSEGYALGPSAVDVLTWSLHEGESFWMVDADSVRLTWTTGHAGFVVHAVRRDDRLTGLVESFWDDIDGVPDPRASFEATRIDCPPQ